MKHERADFLVACALAAAAPVAAGAAGDPLTQAKSDLAKLTADASAANTAVAADGSDPAKLRQDAKKGWFTLKADWKLLLVDAKAARKAGAGTKELRSLLQDARTQMKGFRSAVRTAHTQAAKQSKGSNGPKGSSKAKRKPSQGSDEDGPATRPQASDPKMVTGRTTAAPLPFASIRAWPRPDLSARPCLRSRS